MRGNSNDIRYIEGKIYKSEREGCITDETDEKYHIWTGDAGEDTFVLVSNKRKRRRHGNSRDNRP
jgi:hypothetical protein